MNALIGHPIMNLLCKEQFPEMSNFQNFLYGANFHLQKYLLKRSILIICHVYQFGHKKNKIKKNY